MDGEEERHQSGASCAREVPLGEVSGFVGSPAITANGRVVFGSSTGLFELGHLGTVFLDEIALVPLALQYRLPFTTRPVDVPPWFTTVGSTVPTDDVVLTYPYASSGLRAPLTWQAVPWQTRTTCLPTGERRNWP